MLMDSNTRVFSSYEHIRQIVPEYYSSLPLQDEMVQQRKRLGPLFYDIRPSKEEDETKCLSKPSKTN